MEYVQVKQLRDKSALGWDDGLSRITATDEVWDTLMKVWLFLFVILL